MLQIMARNWWMLLIRGVAAVLFGIAVFLSPGIALAVLVLLWGSYALVDGVFAVFAGIQGRQSNQNWWLSVLEGAAGIVVGAITLLWPGITALAALYLIAGWAIITGLMEIAAAVQLRKEIRGEFWLGLSGLASIIFGGYLVVSPGAGILAVLWLIAAYGIAFGVMMIMLAFRLRGSAGESGQQATSKST